MAVSEDYVYAELCAKTNYSFLEGASHPEEMVSQAIASGLRGIALCDRNGVYGAPKGHRKAKEYPHFKFIVGCELTLKDHPNLILLARDRAGYAAMCRTLTASHKGKEKGEAHLYWREFLEWASLPAARNGWVVMPAVSRGATSGEVAARNQGSLLNETLRATVPRYHELKDLFGVNIFLPLVKFMDGRDRQRTENILKLEKQFGIKPVATNDARYHAKSRKVLHDVQIATKETLPLSQCGYRLFSNGERYIKTPKQMAMLYKDLPEALSRTLEIADGCSFNMKELRYRYPSEWIPHGQTAQEWLTALTWQGACERYKKSSPMDLPEKVVNQLIHELKLVNELSFADYFLTIYDIVKFARSRDILCQGRGSAANSIICYVLGITAIDPIQMDLLFERFISAERGEPPDIDVDFEHERREEVIQYIYEKYGRDRAAMVSAVITYRTRSALREVAKAFGVPVGTLSAKKVEREFELHEQIDTVVEELKGFPRHLSIHSGGFTLSADPITDIVPVEPARMEGRTIIQWDKYDLDELGLLKVDILSLGMLSALKKSLDMVGMKMHEVPHDDPKTYEMIRNVDTVGTFQIESRAQMSMLGRLQPRTFYDLVIELAIVRPGPIMGEMVHPYLRRRRGEEAVTYPHPDVKAILERTLGVPLFQEQVMKLAIKLAKFTPGEADELRRAIGAWRSNGSIHAIGERLKAGMLASGVTEEFAERFFEQIKGFAHYGFPESHSASFALIAYASCYVKCHYPAEFAASIVNSQPMGFYANHTLISDAERHGIEILPIDPNHSNWDCEVSGKTDPQTPAKGIRLGLRVVSGLHREAGKLIVSEREANGPYKNLLDFLRRTRVRKDVLYRMAMAGAFKNLAAQGRESGSEIVSREILWKLLELDLAVQEREAAQTSIFSLLEDNSQESNQKLFKALSPMERLQEDFGAYGLTTHGHPMLVLRKQFPKLPRLTAKDLKNGKSGTTVKVAGLAIVRQKPPTAKGCVFATLEDETGFMDLILHPKTYERCHEVFMHHCFLIVTGELQRDTKTANIIVKSMEPVFKPMDESSCPAEPWPRACNLLST
jgi:error-prone DNA polymerase